MTEEIKDSENLSENISEEMAAQVETKEEDSQPLFTLREMLEAGVHFGHKTSRWNPKMAPYIYGVKNSLHIIDLTQTAILLNEAVKVVKSVVKKGGKVLFVCTKKQGSESVAEAAKACGQYYVNNKWLGGMLTNWKTISQSIKRLKQIEAELADPEADLTKKERLLLDRQREKLDKNLAGIRTMNGRPDLIVIIDTNREVLAIQEARNLNIPIMATLDTNCDPDVVDYPIPGNDDSIKAIKLYCRVFVDAISGIVSKMQEEKGAKKEENNKKGKAAKSLDKKKESVVKNSKKPKTSLTKTNEKLPLKKKDSLPAKNKEEKAPAIKEEKVPTVVEETSEVKEENN